MKVFLLASLKPNKILEDETQRALPVADALNFPRVMSDLQVHRLWFSPINEGDYRQDLVLAAEFFDHMANDRVTFVRQIIASASGKGSILYDECLMRVWASDGTQFSFAKYAGPLERSGLMRAVDVFAVRWAIDTLRSERSSRLGVNIAAQSACCDVWWTETLSLLGKWPEVASRLTIEITETGTFQNPSSAAEFAQRIRALGCRIAIDDFGVGREPISNLFALVPEVVKLDATLLWRARTSPYSRSLLKWILSMSSQLGCETVVEGVETAIDRALAISAGAQWLQGFHIARPAPTA